MGFARNKERWMVEPERVWTRRLGWILDLIFYPRNEPAAADAYALGLLLHTVFNPTHPLPATASPPHPPPPASSRGAIPNSIFPSFKKLLNPNPKGRLTAKGFLAIGMADTGFFTNNRLVKVCLGLDNFALNSESEKNTLLRWVPRCGYIFVVYLIVAPSGSPQIPSHQSLHRFAYFHPLSQRLSLVARLLPLFYRLCCDLERMSRQKIIQPSSLLLWSNFSQVQTVAHVWPYSTTCPNMPRNSTRRL